MLVNISGILSPILQQLLSVEVKRRSSAHRPLCRFSPSNELIFRLRATLYDGPQVGRVATRLFRMTGDPTKSFDHFLNSVHVKHNVVY